MHRKIRYGAARYERREQDRSSGYRGDGRSEQPAAQFRGKSTFAASGLFMVGRFATFLNWQDGFDCSLAGTERDDDAVDALGRHEAGRNRNPDRQRAQHQ